MLHFILQIVVLFGNTSPICISRQIIKTLIDLSRLLAPNSRSVTEFCGVCTVKNNCCIAIAQTTFRNIGITLILMVLKL